MAQVVHFIFFNASVVRRPSCRQSRPAFLGDHDFLHKLPDDAYTRAQIHKMGRQRTRTHPSNVLIGVLLFLIGLAPVFAQTVVPAGDSMLIPAGVLDLVCTSLDVQGNVVVGTGQVDQAGTIDITPTGTLNGGQGQIALGGNWNNNGSFIPGTSTVVFSDVCGSGGGQLTGDTTFNNLTFTSSTGKPFVIPAGSHIAVTGNLVLQGTPGHPLQLLGSSGQTAFITLGRNANVTYLDAQVSPFVQIGQSFVDPSAIPTLGDYALLLLSCLLGFTAAMTYFRPRSESRESISRTKP